MEVFYTVLEVTALIAIILIPLRGPKAKNVNTNPGKFAIGESSLLKR